MIKHILVVLIIAIAIPVIAQTTDSKTTVYYFHGNARCVSCNNMEKYTVVAIREKFAAELENGSIEIKVVNIDRPENKHFVQDYKLYTKSVILANNDGVWKNLDKIWSLARKEQDFKNYIKSETAAFIGIE